MIHLHKNKYPTPQELTRRIIKCPKCGSSLVEPIRLGKGRCRSCAYINTADKFIILNGANNILRKMYYVMR